MLGLRQCQIMESGLYHLFTVLEHNEKEHILFLSKIKEILNWSQSLRNDLEHNEGILKFSLFA